MIENRPLRIAHISDLHILDLAGTRWQAFMNKRITGAANLAGLRRNAHPVELCERLAKRLQADDIDHVIITGDVTNLALDSEFKRARQIVETIGPPAYVTMIPGNHDIYTRGALKHHRFERWFAEYLVDDIGDAHQPKNSGRLHYPFVRKPAPHVRIYGVSSAIPTPPLLAFGHVGKPQLDRLRDLVLHEPPEVTVRIVLVHHNLHHHLGPAEHLASLFDRQNFANTMRDIHASVVLHGHTHHPHQGHLSVRHKSLKIQGNSKLVVESELPAHIPVLGCGSSTWAKNGRELARFNVLEIVPTGLHKVLSYIFRKQSAEFEPEHTDLLAKALHQDGQIAL